MGTKPICRYVTIYGSVICDRNLSVLAVNKNNLLSKALYWFDVELAEGAALSIKESTVIFEQTLNETGIFHLGNLVFHLVGDV
ncbi:hypothetical protein PPE03_04500 [Pseudoalteromonas peptidolytica]|nr:hypothetical protein PPE03_04500 [Pseudoalteromonas peptidolytica]